METPVHRDLTIIRVAALGVLLLPAAAAAQQTQLDVHGNYSVGTTTHARSWGAGAGAQVTFGETSDPVQVSASPGVDYLKQEHGGPSQTSLSLDVNVQAGGGHTVTPYVGASGSANWSGGANRQWDGVKLGAETMAGAQVKLTKTLTGKIEERFGYVSGQEHTLSTRLGALVSF